MNDNINIDDFFDNDDLNIYDNSYIEPSIDKEHLISKDTVLDWIYENLKITEIYPIDKEVERENLEKYVNASDINSVFFSKYIMVYNRNSNFQGFPEWMKISHISSLIIDRADIVNFVNFPEYINMLLVTNCDNLISTRGGSLKECNDIVIECCKQLKDLDDFPSVNKCRIVSVPELENIEGLRKNNEKMDTFQLYNSNKLRSLKGMPEKVNELFLVGLKRLENLMYIPEVEDELQLNIFNPTTYEGIQETLNCDMIISYIDELSNVKGFPKVINGDLTIHNYFRYDENKIKSLYTSACDVKGKIEVKMK